MHDICTVKLYTTDIGSDKGNALNELPLFDIIFTVEPKVWVILRHLIRNPRAHRLRLSGPDDFISLSENRA